MRKPKLVTFKDTVYKQRKITIGDDVLVVKNHTLTVSDPAHIEALEADKTLIKQEH